MTHTSGLGNAALSAVLRDFRPRPGEQYAVGPLLFEPGDQWQYGTSTDWVGRIVESLSGQTLEAYFRDRIFRPLSIVETSYNVPTDRLHRVVAVHERRPNGGFDVRATQPATTVTRFGGSGGLFSTAADYIRFLQMFLNRGTLDGARILSAETVALMARNQIGEVGARALRTARPEVSGDFTFIADGRDKFGLGFLITADQHPRRRSPGSLSWVGINNAYLWVDLARGAAGVVLMQYRPFADARALAVYDAFERAVYRQLLK